MVNLLTMLELTSIRAFDVHYIANGNRLMQPIHSISELCISHVSGDGFIQLITTMQRDYPFLKSLKIYVLMMRSDDWPTESEPAIDKIPLDRVSLRFKFADGEHFPNLVERILNLFPVARYVGIASCFRHGETDQTLAGTISAFISAYIPVISSQSMFTRR